MQNLKSKEVKGELPKVHFNAMTRLRNRAQLRFVGARSSWMSLLPKIVMGIELARWQRLLILFYLFLESCF